MKINIPNSWLWLAAGAGVVAMAASAAARQRRWFDFTGKSVIVTGGSRGLGLVLARKLVDRGAKVTIAARTEVDLNAARDELAARGEVLAVTCDVRDENQVEHLISSAEHRFGTVDVLINVAGVIEVGPFDAMTEKDFRESMDINCWGVLNTVRAVLPIMRRHGWGRIVNVASLGGKRSIPHMMPYCTSKFALVGLSEGMRTEWYKENILVTTICPSLMRTGSPRNATFKGQHRQEYAWFSIGDSLPLGSMSAEAAAEQILSSCQAGEAERIVSNRTNLGIAFQTWFPSLTREIVTFANRLLPEMGGIGQQAAKGYESESEWSPSVLTTLTEQAAEQNNEMREHPVGSA